MVNFPVLVKSKNAGRIYREQKKCWYKIGLVPNYSASVTKATSSDPDVAVEGQMRCRHFLFVIRPKPGSERRHS